MQNFFESIGKYCVLGKFPIKILPDFESSKRFAPKIRFEPTLINLLELALLKAIVGYLLPIVSKAESIAVSVPIDTFPSPEDEK